MNQERNNFSENWTSGRLFLLRSALLTSEVMSAAWPLSCHSWAQHSTDTAGTLPSSCGTAHSTPSAQSGASTTLHGQISSNPAPYQQRSPTKELLTEEEASAIRMPVLRYVLPWLTGEKGNQPSFWTDVTLWTCHMSQELGSWSPAPPMSCYTFLRRVTTVFQILPPQLLNFWRFWLSHQPSKWTFPF